MYKLRQTNPVSLPSSVCWVFTKYDDYPQSIEISYTPKFAIARLRENMNCTEYYAPLEIIKYTIHKIVMGLEGVVFIFYKRKRK